MTGGLLKKFLETFMKDPRRSFPRNPGENSYRFLESLQILKVLVYKNHKVLSREENPAGTKKKTSGKCLENQ